MSTLLEVSGVSVSFDGFKAINNLSFQIGPAEMRAIIGPNGAGKTTFMDIVTGKTKPDEGRVLWGDKSVSLLKMSEAQIAKAGVGRKFQRPTVFEDQSVFDNLLLALKKDRSPFAVLAYRQSAQDCEKVGELARETISQFRFDYAVIGCSALHPDGDILDFDIQEVGVSKAIIDRSEQVFLVADLSKFDRKAPARIGSLADVDTFFTDGPLPESCDDFCARSETKVVSVAPR